MSTKQDRILFSHVRKVGIPSLSKEDANIFPQERTSPEVLYVYAERGKSFQGISKEPTYNYIHGTKGKDWVAISKEQYKNAFSILEQNGSRIRNIPGFQELNAFHLNNCLAILGDRYLKPFDETQNFIGISTENSREKIEGLALMLDLPYL